MDEPHDTTKFKINNFLANIAYNTYSRQPFFRYFYNRLTYILVPSAGTEINILRVLQEHVLRKWWTDTILSNTSLHSTPTHAQTGDGCFV